MSLLLLLATLAPQTDESFERFDRLGYPDAKDLPYIRFTNGRHTRGPAGERKAVVYDGVLLEDKGSSFRVLGLDLETETCTKSKPKTPPYEKVAYEKSDITKAAGEKLQALEAGEGDNRRRHYEVLPGHASPHLQLYVLARWCDRKGHKDLTKKLLEAAGKIPDRRSGKPLENPLFRVVSDEIAVGRIWEGILKFGDLKVSRKDILATFEEFKRKFPESPHYDRAEETARMLRQMTREDEAHVSPKKTLEELPVKERVRELIFRLRDQNGYQLSQPGRCDFFTDARGEKSPAHQLVKIGAPAVPQLIESLTDNRFTRSVGFHRGFYFSHHVLRIGDAALAVIERIAGRTFWERKYTNGAMVKDREAAATKIAIGEWWAEFGKKGEKQMLVEATERGDAQQAARLLARFPEAAPAALMKALKTQKKPWQRSSFVQLLGKIEGEPSTRALLAELKTGPHINSRLMAARALMPRGRPEVIPALISEWKKHATARPDEDEDPFGRTAEAIVETLVLTGHPRAIRALGEDFMKRPLDDRISVLYGLGEDHYFFTFRHDQSEKIKIPGLTPLLRKKADEAAEEVLAAALEDPTVCENRSGGMPGKSYSDPRISEMAASIMAHRWGDRYEFDIGADRRTRNRELALVKNVRRKAKGLPPVPVPSVKTLKSLPAEVVDPLVERVLEGTPGAKKALLDTGLPALKVASARLARLKKSHARRPGLESVVRELATVVAEATLTPRPSDKKDVLAGLVSSLEGRPLTSDVLKAFLIKACLNLPKGTAGYRMTIERSGKLTGVWILVETVTERAKRGRGVPGWTLNEEVMLRGESLLNNGGSLGTRYGTTAEGYKMLEKPVERVLSAPADSPFSIRVSRILKD